MIADDLLHPYEKPLQVIKLLIEPSSDEGDTILDPFTGSGTTGVACIQTGRRFIGIEIEEKYCEIAARRLERALCEAPDQLPFAQADRDLFGTN